MPHHILVVRSPVITAAAFLVAVGFGISLPLISMRLEATGVSGAWIGLNAAMPALGWITGSALLPLLQIRLGIPFKRLLQMFLVIGLAALAGLRFADGYAEMTALRFLFGGAIGVFFRLIEFWINDVTHNEERGRNLGIYNILFMVALIIGSLLQPEFGTAGWAAFAPPLLAIGAGLVTMQIWSGEPAPAIEQSIPPSALGIVLSVPVALLCVLAYGVYESAPTTLMPVYVIRNQLDSATAAHTLTAVALGNLVLQYPVAALSDRIGRTLPLLVCASTVALTSAMIPQALGNATLLLAVVALWGGAAGTTYSMALAMIGDRFHGGRLVVANAAFGIVYAVGSIVGPIVNGFAIDQMNTHGLMVLLAATFSALSVLILGALVMSASRRRS